LDLTKKNSRTDESNMLTGEPERRSPSRRAPIAAANLSEIASNDLTNSLPAVACGIAYNSHLEHTTSPGDKDSDTHGILQESSHEQQWPFVHVPSCSFISMRRHFDGPSSALFVRWQRTYPGR
jgi:hypothetical protein